MIIPLRDRESTGAGSRKAIVSRLMNVEARREKKEHVERVLNANFDNLKFGLNEYRMLHDRVSAVSEPKGAALLEGRQ